MNEKNWDMGKRKFDMNDDGYGGKQKQLTRLRLVKLLKDKVVRETLWLTSWQMRDILFFKKEKIISPKTNILIVEKKFGHSKKIKKTIESLDWSIIPKVIHGQLSNQNVKSMDFCNLDFCGVIDFPTAMWIRNKLKLNKGATISITMSYTDRFSNNFLGFIRTLLYRKYSHLYKEAWLETLDNNVAIQLCMIRSIFRCYNYTLEDILKYRDKTASMVNYTLTNMHSKKPCYPDLLSEIKDLPIFKGDSHVYS